MRLVSEVRPKSSPDRQADRAATKELVAEIEEDRPRGSSRRVTRMQHSEA
jgi:hypothetical protein